LIKIFWCSLSGGRCITDSASDCLENSIVQLSRGSLEQHQLLHSDSALLVLPQVQRIPGERPPRNWNSRTIGT